MCQIKKCLGERRVKDLNIVVMGNPRVEDTIHQLPLVVEVIVPLHHINNSSNNNPHQGMDSLPLSMEGEGISRLATNNHPQEAISKRDMEEGEEDMVVPRLTRVLAGDLVDPQGDMALPHPLGSVKMSGKCFRQ